MSTKTRSEGRTGDLPNVEGKRRHRAKTPATPAEKGKKPKKGSASAGGVDYFHEEGIARRKAHHAAPARLPESHPGPSRPS